MKFQDGRFGGDHVTRRQAKVNAAHAFPTSTLRIIHALDLGISAPPIGAKHRPTSRTGSHATYQGLSTVLRMKAIIDQKDDRDRP
jgi:hypothetical protein